ncbi:hypothetical protein HDU96_003853, partial [Phlyctochytrium bullatum]
AYLALPRSVELEKLLQRIKSEGIIAKKKLAVVELRGRDTFDDDPGISDAAFVFTAFAKHEWDEAPKKTRPALSENSPETLGQEAAIREVKRATGSYQLVNGLPDLPRENRFNDLFKLQGSHDVKREDFYNTTLMLFGNVKTPFTPMGAEEIKGEDDNKSKLFSASSNIKTRGRWQANSRSQKGKGMADLEQDSLNYGEFVKLVAFIAAVYMKVLNTLSQAYQKARGLDCLTNS